MAPALRIGSHVDQADPIAEASARGADLAQLFLGDPQGWKAPVVRHAGGAEGLRGDAEAAGVALYVHAPYVLNVATANNRIRIPSRKLLQQHVAAAAPGGARGPPGPAGPAAGAAGPCSAVWRPPRRSARGG